MRGAGNLRDRVRFERRTTTDDGYGNQEGAWGDLTPPVVRACELKPTRGGESIQAGRLAGTALWDCWVRKDSGTNRVKVGDRAVDVRDESRTFNVRFIGDMDGKNAWLLIQMESGVAEG